MARHGKMAKQGECFPNSNIRFPGDPNGSAAETINCHCMIMPKVILSTEYVDEDGNIRKKEKE